MRIVGADGFVLSETSNMREMKPHPVATRRSRVWPPSRLPRRLRAVHRHDFAPTRDRQEARPGVHPRARPCRTIANPALGRLVNVVTTSEDAPP